MSSDGGTEAAQRGPTWQWNTFRVGVVTIIVAVVALRAWSVGRWSWEADDWVYMERTRSLGFVDYLFQNYNGHVMPGEFLIAWLVTKAAPLAHGVAVVLVPVAAALVTATWALALRELFGERRRLLAPLALISLTPLLLQSTIWWAAALQSLSLLGAMALSVLFAARLDRLRDRSSLVGLLLSFALGLFLWQKALLLVIPLAGVLVFATPGSFRARLGTHRRTLLILAAVAAGYVVAYVALVRAKPVKLTPLIERSGTSRDALDFYGDAFGDLVAPAFLGGPWGSLPTAAEPLNGPGRVELVVVSAVVVATLVSLTALRRRGWLPALMVLVYGGLSWGLVFTSRYGFLQISKVGYERYLVDTFVVGCLALAMLITPTRLEEGGIWRRSWNVSPRTAGLLGTGVVASLVVSLGLSNLTAVHETGRHPAHGWVGRITTDVKRLAPLAIYDAYAPAEVLPPGLWQESARLSRMLSPLHEDIDFDGPAQTLYVAEPDGTLHPAVIGDASHAEQGPVEGCGYAVGAGDEVRVPMTQDLFDYGWGVQVTTLAGEGGTLLVQIDDERLRLEVDHGLTRTQAAFVGPVTDVRLSVKPGSATVCVTELTLGSISPAPEQ
jgi:hypothetical protein